MISSKQTRAAWIDAGTLIQYSGIGGLGKWDGVLILYRSLITAPVYCAALGGITHDVNFSVNRSCSQSCCLYHQLTALPVS